MAQDSKIEWTHHTLNLWHGCAKVHEGCDNCYAETLAKRWGNDIWGADKPRKHIKSAFPDLQKYQDHAARFAEVHRVFVGSMMDIAEKPMPLVDGKGGEILGITNTGALRAILFDHIDQGAYPNLMFLFLSKRPLNYLKYIPESWKQTPPDNVMYGTSISTQESADLLVPHLLQVPGKRFLSIEPQLGLINMHWTWKVDWVICGGESGHNKRPFDPEWARTLRDQCDVMGIPFFMKQIDKIQPIPEDLMIRKFPYNY